MSNVHFEGLLCASVSLKCPSIMALEERPLLAEHEPEEPPVDPWADVSGTRQEFYERSIKSISNIVYAKALEHMRDADQATEMTQAALIRGFYKIDQLKEPKALIAWMQQIVTRLCLSALTRRKQNVDQELLAAFPETNGSDAADTMINEEQGAVVRSQLSKMSKNDREAIRLFYFQNLSIKDIAEREDIPEGTVKRRLHVARNRLRTRLEETQYFRMEYEAPLGDGVPATTKKLATVSKTTRVAGMSKEGLSIATEESVFSAFKSDARRVIGTSPAQTFSELQSLVHCLDEEDGEKTIKGQYGKQFLQILHTHARKVRALLNPSGNGKHTEPGKQTLTQQVIAGTKQIAVLTQDECAGLYDEILYTGEFQENLNALSMTEDDFVQLAERATAPTNGDAGKKDTPPPPTAGGAQLSPVPGSVPKASPDDLIDTKPVPPTADTQTGDDSTAHHEDFVDVPAATAEHIADSIEGTKAFTIAYVLAEQYSPDPAKARAELCEIFGADTASMDQFDLDEYARRLDVPPPNPDAKRLHRPAELKQALRILCKNDQWRLSRSTSRISACFGMVRGNLQAWVDAPEEFLDLSGKKFTVPVKPEERPATMVATEVSTPDVVANTPPEGIAHTTAPEPTESFEPQSVPTPDVRLQQLTAENQELKTRNEKLTTSVELLGKQIQELRTRIDQALVHDSQQSPATQVIEVSPDGTTKNVVRITVEVALAQQK